MKKETIRKASVTAIMGAVGFILMLIEFPLPFIIPAFIKFDFSEIPALITSFAFGPFWGIIVCLIKNLLHLLVGSTAGVGELSNFLLGAIYVGVAGALYRCVRSRKGALIGSVVGAFIMAAISVFTNYFVVYPAYEVLYGMPMEAIVGAYTLLLESVDSLFEALVIFNLPFNLVKGLIDAAICFVVYKKISPIIKPKNNC